MPFQDVQTESQILGALKRAAIHRPTLVLSVVGLVALFAVAPIDRQLAQYAIDHRWRDFAAFQHHTLFEDGIFGGSDFGLFFQILCGAFFLMGWSKLKRSSVEWQQRWGALHRLCFFVTVSSIYSGVVLVQGLKFAWGRARPYLVLGSEPQLYTPWYEFGPLSILDGRYPGSFPSGHVASAAAFVGLLYAIQWKRLRSGRLLGFLVLCGCCVSWFAMGLARVMGRDHWPSDCLAAGLLVTWSYVFFWQLIWPQGNSQSAAGHGSGDEPWLTKELWQSIGRVFAVSLAVIFILWAGREFALVRFAIGIK